ncbi:sigma-70 family RNA polymerase sigma factor [Streptococcus ovuberis]|uniref:Sigma-70 family RNA polymerase sigma factor n=1 Tax=Streptococcus ovuberis TaxID=1936207 RepID=A0A7X6MYW6_9STRE|nr:sigma-70 family RNA polymerase sigma factor [Streptococcus ovuberis]NKZ20980.1 sigma-70 family RNA polymerase sigma factor [Streptococcus ovuberis]
MRFERIYAKVTGIVHKTRKEYYIQLWEQSDWDQEGMIILSRLLLECPGIEEREEDLYRYFKTKFRNYVLDMVRKQESYKRRINRQAYEEVGTIAHKLHIREMAMEDRLILRDMLSQYRSQLPESLKEHYDKLLGGEQFKGRKEMIRDLKSYLKDFKG